MIVAPGVQPASAAKEATKTIPVIYTGGADAVTAGLVASIARPGGNVTGIAELSSELTGKRLELIKETLPTISTVTLLARVNSRTVADHIREIETGAKALGLKLQIMTVSGVADFDKVFDGVTKERNGALIEVPNTLFHTNRKRIVELANLKGLPTIFHSQDFVQANGLMCYGENDAETVRRLAAYVNKNSQRRQTRGSSYRATNEIRTRDQFEDCQRNRRNDSPERVGASGQSHTMTVSSQQPATKRREGNE